MADDDVTIPRAALNKMVKEILPHVRVSSDARELILNCCTEFVHLVSSEANEICNKQSKKTIAPEHVLDALDSLGFKDYLNDCKSTLEQCKNVVAKKRRGSNRLENLGIPEEELLRQQQELFEKARLEQAAIEQQEWLQLQAAQEGCGQYLLPGTTEQPPAAHPGTQGISLHQPWLDQKPPVATQGAAGAASQMIPSNVTIKKELDPLAVPGTSHMEHMDSRNSSVNVPTTAGQQSSAVMGEAGSPTVIKSEPPEDSQETSNI